MTVADAGPYVVSAVSASTMTVTTDIAAISSDWVVLVPYDAAAISAAGRGDWAWIAGTDGKLGAASDDAFTWVII